MAAITNARTGYRNGTTSGWSARSLHGVGDDLYAVVLDTSAVKIRVYKGTGDGTWTEQDSANAVSHTNAVHSYDSAMPLSGTGAGYIYIAYRTATNTVRVRRFNTATDTWEGSDVGGADATTTAREFFTVRIAIRSDGDVLVVYKHSTSNDTWIVRYEGSSWSSPAAVLQFAWNHVLDVALTGSDLGHIIVWDESNNQFFYYSYSSTNSKGLQTTVGSFPSAMRSSIWGYVNHGGTERIAAMLRDSGGESRIVHSALGTGSWNNVTSVAPTSTTDMGIMGSVVVPYSGQWHVIWSGDGRGEIHYDYSDDYSSPAFGTDSTIVSGLSATDPAVYAIASAYGIPVLYTDLTSPPAVDIVWAVGAPPAGGGGDTAIDGTDTVTPVSSETGTVAATIASAQTVTPALTEAGTVAATTGATDTLTPSLTETGAVTAQISSTDTLTPTLTDSGTVAATVAIAGTDTLTPALSDTATVAAGIAGTDTATPAITDSGDVAATITVESTDTLTPALADTGTIAAQLAATDAIAPALTDTGTVGATIAATDTATPVVSEDGSLDLTTAVSSTDTITPGLTDSGTVAASVIGSDTIAPETTESGTVTAQVAGTDTATPVLSESGSVEITAGVDQIAGTDAVAPSLTESSTVAAATAATDALTPTLSESATVVVHVMSSDTLTPALTHAGALAAMIGTTDVLTVVSAESAAVLAAIAANDVAAVLVSESSSIVDTDYLPPPTLTAILHTGGGLSATLHQTRLTAIITAGPTLTATLED